MRNPAGSAGPSLGRQIRHCHLFPGALVALTWAVPAQRSPLAGPASSLDWEAFISEENLGFQTSIFPYSRGKPTHAKNNSLNAVS